jgi:hypothetical protein
VKERDSDLYYNGPRKRTRAITRNKEMKETQDDEEENEDE